VPEMFLTGYNIGPAAARRLAEPRDGDSARRVGRIALERRLAILCGYPERGSGDSVFNAASSGRRQRQQPRHYRKTPASPPRPGVSF
jgi:predicted amidohydrolase